MRLLFATNASCPIHLMYLESGQMPARFQMKRMMINYFQYILHQDVDSMLFKMLMAQFAKPVKGDYCQKMQATLIEVGISSTMQEIKKITKKSFGRIVKQKCMEVACKYIK